MARYRIKYRMEKGGVAQARIVEAPTLAKALDWPRYSTVSITVQCEGTLKNGEPCTRFSHYSKCHLHRTVRL